MEWRGREWSGGGREGGGEGRAGQGRAGQGARLLRWTFTGRDFIPLNTPVERAATKYLSIDVVRFSSFSPNITIID